MNPSLAGPFVPSAMVSDEAAKGRIRTAVRVVAGSDEIPVVAVQRESETERQAYLDEVCAARPGMRDQVLALLKLHQGAGDFLLNPAMEPGATGIFLSPAETRAAHAREAPGMTIGPYKLLQQFGEGGMGTVFMAQQTEPIQRKVALKIIKARMDTDQRWRSGCRHQPDTVL